MRNNGWVGRAIFIVIGLAIIFYWRPQVDQPPIEFLFRWGIGPAFLYLAITVPRVRVSASNVALIVWQVSPWRSRNYEFPFHRPAPPLGLRINSDAEGPDSFTLWVEVPGGRHIDLITKGSEAEALEKKRELMDLWGAAANGVGG